MPATKPEKTTCPACKGEGADRDGDQCQTCYGDGTLTCIQQNDKCRGAVELRYPGYGYRHFARCEFHGDERLRKHEQERRRYPDSPFPPAWFDPLAAGETWDEA